jgi:hypothetical protein
MERALVSNNIVDNMALNNSKCLKITHLRSGQSISWYQRFCRVGLVLFIVDKVRNFLVNDQNTAFLTIRTDQVKELNDKLLFPHAPN